MARLTGASTVSAWRDRAAGLFPGGVNSPVRAYGAVGGLQPIMVRGEGALVWDAESGRYIDYVCAFGPLILGHAHPAVVRAIHAAVDAGGSFGATTPAEVRLAELIRSRMPSIERIRFVSSGTEAAMSALRLARAATGREVVIKFEGGYHGHADSMLVEAGSGAPHCRSQAAPASPRRSRSTRWLRPTTTSTRWPLCSTLTRARWPRSSWNR